MFMETLLTYFPDLSKKQIHQFSQLEHIYKEWNARINLISRKDIEQLYIHHVLHSLGIAKVQPFVAGSRILDAGTGGGFPGVPLAILFPQTSFYLADAIGKKIKAVTAIVTMLDIKNVQTAHIRVEDIVEKFDFVVSRAVTHMPQFVSWVGGKIKKESQHELKNGILYLKGGDLTEELKNLPKAIIYPLKNYFKESFFETKKVVYLPV